MHKFLAICVSALFILGGCSVFNEEKESSEVEAGFPMNLQVEEIEAVNQEEEEVTLLKYKGDVWLASFIFTNCDTVCSPMTATMSKLQKEVADEGLEVKLVSFSIDPEQDSPAILKQYALDRDAEFYNWDFLTGYDQKTIESFANISFLSPAAKIEGSNQFVHSTSIYLVSKSGTVLQQYDLVSDTPFEQIIEDIKKID